MSSESQLNTVTSSRPHASERMRQTVPKACSRKAPAFPWVPVTGLSLVTSAHNHKTGHLHKSFLEHGTAQQRLLQPGTPSKLRKYSDDM